MAKEHTDRRSQYTRDAIRAALLELCARQNFSTIRVAQLCRQAQISRGTFYLHYASTTQVLNEVLEGMAGQMDMFPPDDQAARETCVVPMCQFFRERPEYRALLLDDDLSAYLVNWLIRSRGPEMYERLSRHTDLPPERMEALLYFQLSGCLAICRRSLRCGQACWHDVRQTIDTFVRGGLAALGGGQ